jgi:alkylation response protein AidB-like acyl-CoA dehydrogenase
LKQYASPELQKKYIIKLAALYAGLTTYRILPEILSGEKRICLAITEPSAGSDVRNITTTAKKSADGTHYIVNGEKKIRY